MTYNYSVRMLTVCSVTSEREKKSRDRNNLCIIQRRMSKHESTAALSAGKRRSFISSVSPLITLMIKKQSELERSWLPAGSSPWQLHSYLLSPPSPPAKSYLEGCGTATSLFFLPWSYAQPDFPTCTHTLKSFFG